MEEKIHKLIDIIGKEKYDACIAEGIQVVTCPICGRETFDNKNFYSEETLFACPHCYWKYDGVVAEGEYSADNNSDVVAYKKLYALKDELANEDSHYWQELKKYEVDAFLWNFAEPLDLDVEKVLLARTQSENQEIATYAKRYLLLAYVFGVHKIHGVTEGHFKNLKLKCDYPDYEKIKMLTPKVVLEWNDVNSLLYAAYEYVYDVTALEAALLAVEGELYDKGMKTNGHAKSILFHLYRFGKYETLIYDRDITINAPELKDEEKYNFFYKEYEVFLKAFGMEHMPDPYEPDAHDQMMLYLFGTNFGYDLHDYPTQDFDDPSAKNLERALEYLPTFVDYLAAEKLPDRGMERVVERMEKAGYSSDEIVRLCRAWFETIEKKNLVCEPFMGIYLFGKYEFESLGRKRRFDFADKKSFSAAKSFVRAYVAWLGDVYSSNCVYIKDNYDPDLVLKRLVRQMREFGYSDEDVTAFATLWMQEMMKRGKAFYSLMYLRLFGEHFGGMRVNIDGIKDFDRALELIPDYLEYIFAYEGLDDEYSGKFDPDRELYKLIVAMRKYGYSDEEINVLAMRWVNTVDALVKPCNSPIYVYLFNQFVFKHENFKLDLIENKKSFEQALCYLPKWVEYLTDMSVQYHDGYGETDIFDLLIDMKGAGYEKEEIEKLLSAFLGELAAFSPYEVNGLERNLSCYEGKEPWLTEYRPVFEQYSKVEEAREEIKPTFTFTPLNL